MNRDGWDVALKHAREWQLTPDDLRRAADVQEHGLPSLRQALNELVRSGHNPAAQRYPQGRRRILDGDAELGSGTELTAYGDLPCTRLTLRRLEKDVAVLHRLVGEREIACAKERGRPFAADNPNLHGHAAAEQYVRAARAIDRALVDGGWRARRQLRDLADPERPGPSREQSLEDEELCEYLQALLWSSADPVLDAVLWVIDRVTAARLHELIGLSEVGAKPSRPSVTIAGKGSRAREMPVHAPVLRLGLELSAQRPGRGLNRLFRTRAGTPVTVKHFEKWSETLHRSCPWAAGHDMRLHVLRHTTAQDVEVLGGAHADGAALYLGHELKVSLGTIATYLGLSARKLWTLRAALAANTFGRLDEWPRLPENDVLAEVLPMSVRHD